MRGRLRPEARQPGPRRGIIALLIPLLAGSAGLPARAEWNTAPFSPGEVLQYKVRWGPFRLGTLVVAQESAPNRAHRVIVSMQGDSDPRVPFLDLHFTNRAELLPAYPILRDFTYRSGKDGQGSSISYSFDPDSARIRVEVAEAGCLQDTLYLESDRPVYDAGGLFMLLRCMAGTGRSFGAASAVDQAVHTTLFRSVTKRKEIRCPALDKPTSCVRMEGEALWTLGSCAGLTGEFDAWISADSIAVPIRASARIFLGSIVLELESIRRPGAGSALAGEAGAAPSEMEVRS